MDYAAAYLNCLSRLGDLAGDLRAEDLEIRVPASPAWTVKDTYAHLSGVAADMVGGHTAAAPTDAWTAAQVIVRRDWSLSKIMDEWHGMANEFARMIGGAPDKLWRFTAGTWLHEQDIRAAVGLRGLRHTDGGEAALAMVDLIGDRIDASDLPALQIEAEDRTWLLGTGSPAASLRAPDLYELARAVGGRRSALQMRAFGWDGDPQPYLPLLATYPPPNQDLVD